MVHITTLELNSIKASVIERDREKAFRLGLETRDHGVGRTIDPAREAAPLTAKLDPRMEFVPITILGRKT